MPRNITYLVVLFVHFPNLQNTTKKIKNVKTSKKFAETNQTKQNTAHSVPFKGQKGPIKKHKNKQKTCNR